ncbi:hypothetical protein GPECTOR_3g219 [Gonium pectorale]|uniref:Uncharacterized protein n=1 Tax=Gonium pectorale TaxID=33097 RepID=A0A150GZ04_GONPE|nr:hypothetical protein GPECTOR_3g219 [Gonium pectorale]|eukprot:KXZ55061.1 hypothetical protein GPECTOR_3g219 [Gonium pectorale]
MPPLRLPFLAVDVGDGDSEEDRRSDVEAVGYAASAAAQGVLLQAYRWALFAGSPDVRPAHVAHALLAAACFSRFRTGFVTDPPAQWALELFAVLPGLVLVACAALGYRLPPGALPSLLLPDQSEEQHPDWGTWLTPQLLGEWLGAMAFHGLAPEPRSASAASAGAPAAAATIAVPTSAAGCGGGNGGADSGTTAGGVEVAGHRCQRCHAWLERHVLRCLSSATAWELPALAARLAALAAADPGWARCAARATELACRACLTITPLWNGNRIYQDLINIGDAILTMATLAASVGDGGGAALDCGGGGRGGAVGDLGGAGERAWLAPWAAVELPYQAQRWARKLAARVHKGGPGGMVVGSRRPLPREPEWPTFEQAAMLLLQAVRLASATATVTHGSVADRSGTDSPAPRPSTAKTALPLPPPLTYGLLANLLVALQAQLRTCSAGPEQLGLVRLALEELCALEGSSSCSEHDTCTGAAAFLCDALVRKYARWLPAAQVAYGHGAGNHGDHPSRLDGDSSGGCSGGSGGSDGGGGITTGGRGSGISGTSGISGSSGGDAPCEDVASPSRSSSSTTALMALLPSFVLGQTYRTWAPDLTPPVAAALHRAYFRVATARGAACATGDANAAEPLDTGASSGGAGASAAAAAEDALHVARRCLARLHYPITESQTDMDADPTSSSTVGAGISSGGTSIGGTEDPWAWPRHAPYDSSSSLSSPAGRAAGSTPLQRRGGNHAPPAPAAAQRLLVAREYPDVRNLSPLPPAHRLLQLQAGAAAAAGSGRDPGPGNGSNLSGAPAGLLVALLRAGLVTPASVARGTLAAGPGAEADSALPDLPTVTGAADADADAGADTPRTALSPGFDSRARELRLAPGVATAVVRALVCRCPPECLRPEELWLLHVVDRDARLTARLRREEQEGEAGYNAGAAMAYVRGAQHERSLGTGQDGGEEGSLAARWQDWLGAACRAKVDSSPGLCDHHSSASPPSPSFPPPPSPSPPPVSVPTNCPPTALRPALPPVCRLELLLLQGRHAAAQAALAAMWQGDWYRGDATSLARFSATELLFVMCALVHLKELEELGGVSLGWLSGDGAADEALRLLACPSLAALLAHPAAAWGVGPGGPYAPRDLAAEKRVRGAKLLDAAAGVDEYFERTAAALRQVAATGSSGVLGGGRLDPYRTLDAQGDSAAAFEGQRWLEEGAAGGGAGEGEAYVSTAGSADGGSPGTGGGGGGWTGGMELLQREGVSVTGLRARRAPGARGWEALLGREGAARLRSALAAMGYDPAAWMAGR